MLNETPNESTPIGQRRLFTGPNDDDDEDTDNDGRSEIHRLYTQSQELDLGLVHKDDEDDGDCGSNCDAAELEDLNNDISNMENRLEVLVKQEDDDNMEDSEKNGTLVVVGLGPEVSVFSEPADWSATKPRTKTEVGEPQFSDVDNPGEWGQYTFRPKFAAKPKGKDEKKDSTPITPYQLAQLLFQLMPQAKEK